SPPRACTAAATGASGAHGPGFRQNKDVAALADAPPRTCRRGANAVQCTQRLKAGARDLAGAFADVGR
ncbi:hypothetical protein, partial [Pseudonocardia bannensis]|uniref:hypothetical protein n=1 Tax=Pseudonocardia bannensis TaxID=630973 RepID=UPI001B7CE86B